MGCGGCGKRRRAFKKSVQAAKDTPKKPITRAERIENRKRRIVARNTRMKLRNERMSKAKGL